MVPGIAWIADQRPMPMLRKLCGLLVALVLARILWDPRIVGSNVGTTPIFNWLLWGYGVPAVSFWIAGHLLRRRGDDLSSRSVESAAITFTALTAFLEIRHLMNDGDIYRPGVGLGELGLQVSTGLAMVIGLEHVRARVDSIIHDWGARIFAALAFLGIIRPAHAREPDGHRRCRSAACSSTMSCSATASRPCCSAILARVIKTSRPQPYYIVAAVSSIVLMLVYLTLEVRTLFQGSVLNRGLMSDAEDYTYSAVWLAFGVALLIAGICLKSQPARLRVGRGRDPDHRQGVPARPRRRAGHLPRAVVHRTRPGADGDRLALPAPAVPRTQHSPTIRRRKRRRPSDALYRASISQCRPFGPMR